MSEKLIGRVFASTLRQFVLPIVMFVVYVILVCSVGWLYHVDVEPFRYAAVLIFFVLVAVFVVFLAMQYVKAYKRQKLLNSISTEWMNLPKPDTVGEADYERMIEKLGRELAGQITARENDRREMSDYYTTWAHQIKTPIAVMRLLLEGEDSKKNQALSAELFRIEQYVEMALNYTRLDDGSDLLIQTYDLDDLIRQAIRKYASQFIYKKIKLEYEPATGQIITDKKWFLSIMEQLLSNAIKYTPQGSVKIYVDEQGRIHVQDTGIGIAPEDIPRIFEKGFTGINGRKDQKATGLGLYLCKKAADQIGLQVSVTSTPGEGSDFMITLCE